MPIQPPALDDRSFEDLLQDLLVSIPAHTPEWTSPQMGDPGRTLLELFAWLGDAVLYRANLVPEKQRLAFLKLLGIPLQPASAARGLVQLSGEPANTQVVSLAPGAVVGDKIPFETLGGIDLLPIEGQVFRKAPLTAEQSAEAMPLLTGLQALYKLGARPTGYYTKQVFGNGVADPSGVDLKGDTLDRSLWIAVLAPKAGTNAAVLDALGGKDAAQRILNVGFVPALKLADPFEDIGARAAVAHSWQLALAPGPDGLPRFDELKVFDDTTQGLTRPGIIRLGLPQASDIGAPPNDVRADARAGVGLKPPRIDDADTQARVVTWVRLKAKSALGVSWLGVNAVAIDQYTTKRALAVGVSDGSANQQFRLPATQIEPASCQLEVDMPGLGYQLWRPTEDLSALPGPVPAYLLDAEAGVVTFGDNLRGSIPPAGRRIRIRQLRSGGSSTGNLAAGTLAKIDATTAAGEPVAQKITVKQPVATTGGAEAESLEAAERRIPGHLRHRDRAVTADDYRSLVEGMPGTGIGRVAVLPLFKPQNRATNVPGVVSVMIIPEKDNHQPPCPRADRPLLETVFAHLKARKPVSAELYVIATEYVGIGIAAAVEVLAGFDLRVTAQKVEQALRDYLWPLAPGGTQHTGWQLGRHVRALELEVIVAQVEGVVEVAGFNLFLHRKDGGYDAVVTPAGGQQEVTLAAYQLPELLEVKVVAAPDGSGPSAPSSLAPDADDTDGEAVPVVPRVC